MFYFLHVFALSLTFISSSKCAESNAQSSVANEIAKESDVLSSELEEMLAQRKSIIDAPQNQLNADRPEIETNVLINENKLTQKCIKNWTKYQSKCIKVFDWRLSYPKAEHFCKRSKATMISIHSAEEIKFVLKLVREIRPNFNKEKGKLWIGAKRARSGINGFDWNNKKILSYSNWDIDEPNDSGKYVVMFSDGLWAALDSGKSQLLFACEKYTFDGSEEVGKIISVNCTKGWTQYKNKCLKYFNEKVKFQGAKQVCESNNSTMISIHSAKENEFIRKFVENHSNAKSFWIGAKRKNSGSKEFGWIDNSRFNYSNWGTNEPDNLGGNEFYVVMSISKGVWNDVPEIANNGYIFKFPFVCESIKRVKKLSF